VPTYGPAHPSRAAHDVEAVRRRAAAIVRASGMRRPPFLPERYAARCGVAAIITAALDGETVKVEHRAGGTGRMARTVLLVDRGLPPHTPQWNGAVALGLGEALAAGGGAADRRPLAEAAAAELLLPMPVFRPAATRTDLTVDGVRELAGRFAAPLRLTARQWLVSGLWHGLALLWREDAGTLRLWWRAASPGLVPASPALGADAAAVWAPGSRLFATQRTGRSHHGVEEVRLGTRSVWWFVRFAALRDPADRADSRGATAVFAMVMLARGSARRDRPASAQHPRRGPHPEGILAGSSN
jgi:hypothetical protein